VRRSCWRQSVIDEDRALTRLICDETDRIVSLVDRMEVFPTSVRSIASAAQHPCRARPGEGVAKAGFAPQHQASPRIYDPSLPPVFANRDQLVQVFLNLVKNAAEAIGERSDGEIQLTTAYRPGIRLSVAGSREKISLPLEFCVHDNGPGVPSDLLPHLFDPFITTKTNGSGLGLALVAKIIGGHGGIVECDSQGSRTTFRVLMPMSKETALAKTMTLAKTTGTNLMTGARVLVADDDAAIRTVLNQALSRAGYDVRITSNAATLWRWISAGEGDLVVTDVVMPDENAFDLLPRIKKARPDLPVLVMSAQNTFMTAIKASEKGAYDYLPKPFDLTELIAIIGRALSEPKRKPARLDDDTQDGMPLVGRSAAMQEIYRVLARLMQTDLTLMITGESGTGKELVARALHDYGKRRNGPFVAINMAAIPRDLIESELFGHEKGAFTGAQTRSTGRFEQAEGGTLFLDEIGDMPMDAQTRLLRVLQQGEYTTVGGRTPIRTDVRIVAATNKDLKQSINQGLFREDLYYRLNVVPLRLPPLRDRAEDIPDLVRHFVQQAEKEGLDAKRFDQEALE
jgi:two-component system nitrogen regulation response regulator GlnG